MHLCTFGGDGHIVTAYGPPCWYRPQATVKEWAYNIYHASRRHAVADVDVRLFADIIEGHESEAVYSTRIVEMER